MDDLNNLVKIVTDRKISMSPLLNLADRKGSKESALVYLLEKEPEATSSRIIKELYGNATESTYASYRKLKSRVQQKLLNNLYFLDHNDPRFPVSRNYETQCIQLFHQANILKLEGEYTLSEKMMRKCLRIAVEAEFTTYSILSARALRTLYVDRRQPTRFASISVKLKRLQEISDLEELAEHIYWDIRMSSAHNVQTRRVLLEKMSRYIAELEGLYKKAKSFNTFNSLYFSKISEYELTGDYNNIIKYTAEVNRQWERGKINQKRFDKRFNNFMSVYAHLRSRQVHKGLKLAEKFLLDIHYSSGNWFYFMEHYFLLAMHAGKYSQARELLAAAHKNPYYRKQRVAAQQRWDLFEAYLHFVFPESSPLRAMHFARFVQSVPDFSRDKQGYNIAILILQFLYYLRNHETDALLARLEGLRKYQQRHLRDAATLRSQLFLRMLLLVVKEDFSLKNSTKKGQSLLERLREVAQPGEAFSEIEVIPYEDLWLLTLDILRQWYDVDPQRKLKK
ncbi:MULTISPECIES: hypothetical protein [Hymenobacter]|uniref:Tetratricopeptide repeat protein n=1 Tax=Hymenobacter profundi TaxID=1982110 RepID=A0ABS6X5F9_9BACT|nr:MULTISPECIES: hypothetical protein [Hymenobacter]MBW3131071.1 hypothetical protein [Hymenobacter profundi]QNE40555.1 hypothetical protein F1C16_13780 [Hymenobacter sp. NBH84]